jgi:clan AA aspartic protease (TIGR02281 family)
MSSQPPKPSAEQRWSPGRRESVIFFAILGALVFWFHEPLWETFRYGSPLLPASLLNDVGSDKPLSDGQYAAFNAEYAPLYEKLGVKPLDREPLRIRQLRDALTRLSRNSCDLPAAEQAANSLTHKGEFAVAADFERAIGEKCPEAHGLLQRAGDTFMNVGDYGSALAAAEQLVRKKPDATAYLFLEARALGALNRHEEALATYVAVARLMGEPKRVRADVFTRMSDEFESLGRFCEAMTPIETYIAADPEKRSNSVMEARIEEDRRRGNCEAAQAGGVEVLHRLSTGLVRTRVAINGVEGNFLVDTGASFVSLSPEFAKRAKLNAENAELKQFLTANGAVNAPVVTIISVRLGRLTATTVPAVVMPRPVGPGYDGLLGMSFLARFEMSFTPTEWRIKAKKPHAGGPGAGGDRP